MESPIQVTIQKRFIPDFPDPAGWFKRARISRAFYAAFRYLFCLDRERPTSIPFDSSESLGLWRTHPVRQVSIARVGANVIPIRIDFHEQNSRPCFITFI